MTSTLQAAVEQTFAIKTFNELHNFNQILNGDGITRVYSKHVRVTVNAPLVTRTTVYTVLVRTNNSYSDTDSYSCQCKSSLNLYAYEISKCFLEAGCLATGYTERQTRLIALDCCRVVSRHVSGNRSYSMRLAELVLVNEWCGVAWQIITTETQSVVQWSASDQPMHSSIFLSLFLLLLLLLVFWYPQRREPRQQGSNWKAPPTKLLGEWVVHSASPFFL